jgi:hypothetical protein
MNGNRAMKRFRLFRSRAFWFGVPGLVGLLWGWWVSMGYWSWVGLGGTESWGIGQMGGQVFIVWNVDRGPEWGDFRALHWKISGYEARIERYKLAAFSDGFMPTRRQVLFPYLWLVTGYLAGWAALLIWRKRKFEKRMSE